MELFRFSLSPLAPEEFREEVARALEQYTEARSRAALPGLWRITDKLRKNHPAQASRQPSKLGWLLAGVCLYLGLVLLVTGLMEPSKMPLGLAVGCFAVVIAAVRLWFSWRKILGWLLLPPAVFFGVAGLAAPAEMTAPLVVGIASLTLSLAAFLTAERAKNDRYIAPADQLLAAWAEVPVGQVDVVFTEETLEYQSADGVDHGGGDTLPCRWEDLLCAVETERLFFLAFENEARGILLKKACLYSGSAEEVSAFLTERANFCARV